MKWISLGCVLCLLQLANAICECGEGQRSFIPAPLNIDSPSPFNGTDGSPSSFGSTCVNRSRSLYICSDNTDNPLFNCGASNNTYYGWDSNLISIAIDFSRHFQSMNILVTFLISTSSNASAPSSVRYAPFIVQNISEGSVTPVEPISEDNLPTNLPEGPYQHNFTLSRDMMFTGVIITITPNTTFQWVAINRIIFCAAATEDQTVTSSPGTPSLSVSSVPTKSSAMLPTMSSAVSPTVSDSTTSDSEDDEIIPIALLVAAIAIAIFLLIIVVLLTVVFCYMRRKKSNSEKYTVEALPKSTTVHEGYEMFTADTLPSSLANGITNAIKNDYDYPQLPLQDENDKSVDIPEYSISECKKIKSSTKGSSSTLPASFGQSNIDIALYEMPSLMAASSKTSFNKVIEDGEPVYYMVDEQYSFYEKSKSLNALEDVDLQPYSSIYDDPQPLMKSEAPNYVKPGDIKEIKLLGDGQFGEVYLAEVVGLPADMFDGIDPSSSAPLQVAIKRLRGNPSEGMQQAFEKEIKFMTRLKHKHVIRLLGICTDPSQPFIMIEYAKNGDLNGYLRSLNLVDGNLPPSKKEITKLGLLNQCTQIASGMEYLSSLNFVHRDLAARNILVGEWNQVKIADFGMSRNLYDSDYYRVKGHAIVPIRWMATESFYGRFSVKSDVWAFGVVVWEVFTMCAQRPYEEMTDAELIQDARNAEKRKLLQKTEHCPDQVYQVLLQCWKSLPAERPNFTQLHDQFTRLCS